MHNKYCPRAHKDTSRHTMDRYKEPEPCTEWYEQDVADKGLTS